MRFSRLVLGFLVIFAALWVIVSEQMAGASADAVVNGQVITITSPIAGKVTEADRFLGAAVSAGDNLAVVVDDRPDGTRLDDLILQRDLLKIRSDLLAAQRDALTAQDPALSERTETYQTKSLEDLKVRLSEAQERLRILGEGGADADGIRQSLAREEVARIQIAIAAAQSGVFIAGGFNDAPYSEQMALDLTSRRALLAAELDATGAELTALERRIDVERIRVGRAASATLTAPVAGIIWERLAPSGVQVQRGDAVLRLVDCENTFVTLSVTQPVFNRLRLGTTAKFRFDDSGEVFTGTVARLAGPGAASIYGSLAVGPSQRHLERADVTLSLPTLSENPELHCAIGRTGRAFFETRPLDWLRSFFE